MIQKANKEDTVVVSKLFLQWIQEDITWYVQTPNLEEKLKGYFFVYKQSDQIIAFVIAEKKESAEFFDGEPAELVEIQDLYVVQEYRKSGVGTKLIRHLMQAARQDGVQHFTVYTANKNMLDTYRFYEKFGFKPNWLEMYL